MAASTMRDPSPREQEEMNLGYAMMDLMDHPSYQLIEQKIRSLKDGAVEAVLVGLDRDEYRQKIGFIEALSSVLGMPGELVERGAEVRDSLYE